MYQIYYNLIKCNKMIILLHYTILNNNMNLKRANLSKDKDAKPRV